VLIEGMMAVVLGRLIGYIGGLICLVFVIEVI
jgi:hypothetical protein